MGCFGRGGGQKVYVERVYVLFQSSNHVWFQGARHALTFRRSLRGVQIKGALNDCLRNPWPFADAGFSFPSEPLPSESCLRLVRLQHPWFWELPF